MRGRVTSTVTMTAMALATLAPLLAGLLVEHVSTSWAIGAFAAAQAIAAVLTLLMPGLKDVDSPPTRNFVDVPPLGHDREGFFPDEGKLSYECNNASRSQGQQEACRPTARSA